MRDLRLVMLLLLLFLLFLLLLLQFLFRLFHLLDFLCPLQTSFTQTGMLLFQILEDIVEVVDCRNEDFVVLILGHSQTSNSSTEPIRTLVFRTLLHLDMRLLSVAILSQTFSLFPSHHLHHFHSKRFARSCT